MTTDKILKGESKLSPMQQLELGFKRQAIMLNQMLFLTILTQFIKEENWEGIAAMIEAFDKAQRSMQVTKANEYLKSNPMECIIP